MTGIFPSDNDAPARTGAEELDAAVQSAIGNARAISVEPVEPIGMTWKFDYAAGRFVRRGLSPVRVKGGVGAVAEWCMLVLRVERFNYVAVLPDDYGIERADDPIGSLVDGAALRDFEARVRDCLLQHDRITSIANFAAHYEGDAIIIDILTIHTDGLEPIDLQEVRLPGLLFN